MAVVQPSPPAYRLFSLWAILTVLALLLLFGLATADLARESLWNDETWTAWAVNSPYLADTLTRVRADVHPPLYFLLLDGWTLAAGDTVYTLRLFSSLCGMVALAATYAVGRRLFDAPTGFIGLVVLGTASFFVYYAREARMYSLLLALGTLATWAYLHWLARPTILRAGGYALLLAALLYTHYAGAFLVITHILHLTVSRIVVAPHSHKRSIFHFILPYIVAVILFLPWLPAFMEQMRANPGGPLAFPLKTDWNTVAALLLLLTGGSDLLLVMPYLLGSALLRIRANWQALLLLLCWLLLTPLALLALNAWVAPVYQVRYTIAILPAGALLLAYGLRWSGDIKYPFAKYLKPVLVIALLSIIAVSQLNSYQALWPGKPPWETTIRAVIAARDPLEPTITDLAPYSPSAYYDRMLGLRQGVSLDLSWRIHNAEEIRDLLKLFDNTPSVWVALPVNTVKTWHITAGLDAERGIGYRNSLINMIFYRFDQGKSDDLRYRFGDLLRYEAGPSAADQFVVRAGEQLCLDLTMTTLGAFDGSYSLGLHLLDLSGTRGVAQWDSGLGVLNAGEQLELRPCLEISPNLTADHYHLQLLVYKWASPLERLPVVEDGGGEIVGWGDALSLAAVDIIP